jgi:IS5 family transposase
MRRPNQYPQTWLRWDRTRIDTTEGARIWTGHGILAHNLVKISTLAA